MTDVADLVADVVRLRPASLHYYVSSAGFKACVDSWGPLLEEVRAELRALPMPERMVEERLRGIVGRTLEGAERAAAEDATRMMAMLGGVALGPGAGATRGPGATSVTARVSVPRGRLAAACRDIHRGLVDGWALVREHWWVSLLALNALVWLT